MIKKILIYFVSFLLLLYLSILSIWLNLSSEKITPWLEHQINAQLPKDYEAGIYIANTHLFGLTLEQLQIHEKTSREIVLDVVSMELELNLLSLVFFQQLPYSLEIYKGEVQGTLNLLPQLSASFTITGLQPNHHLILQKTKLITSEPILKAEGEIIFTNPPEGKVSMEIQNINLAGDPKITNLPFKLPSTQLSYLKGDLTINKNRIDISAKSGGDISVNADGSIIANWKRIKRSRLDLIVKGKIEKNYETKLGFIKDMLNNYKNNTGQLSVKITGNLQRPNPTKI